VTEAVFAPRKDGADITLALGSIATDTASFIQSSSSTVTEIATDPLGRLVGQGLNFLVNAVQPIQDAIHFVSGDGPALGIVAENFGAIATGLDKLAKNFGEVADDTLEDWHGDAAKSALGEFVHGIESVAGSASPSRRSPGRTRQGPAPEGRRGPGDDRQALDEGLREPGARRRRQGRLPEDDAQGPHHRSPEEGRRNGGQGVLGYNPAKTLNDHLGKVNSHVKNAKKASDYDGTGHDQPTEETRADMDF
jgi:hypothetical protein